MTDYRLMDGASGRPGVGSSGTQPPSAATAFTGGYSAGFVVAATAWNTWLKGYRWWVPASGGVTAAQEFALWQASGSAAGKLVSGGTVTSGTLTAGTFNEVLLPAPLAWTANIPYCLSTGFTSTSPNGFPDTLNQFGSAEPYSAGITSGPVTAYSSITGSAPVTGNWLPQSPFGTPAGGNPTLAIPSTNDHDDLLWLDGIWTNVAPAGASYRLWPNYPQVIGGIVNSQTLQYTLGTEVWLSQPCALNEIDFYSPAGSTALPTGCGIWSIATGQLVPGCSSSSPAWSGAAGSLWVSCSFGGTTVLPAGKYITSAWYTGGQQWFTAPVGIFTGAGAYAGGISSPSMPISVPSAASSTFGAAGVKNVVAGAYPNATSGNGEGYYVDARFTPASGSGLLMASGIV